jgi:hypothetical protein
MNTVADQLINIRRRNYWIVAGSVGVIEPDVS